MRQAYSIKRIVRAFLTMILAVSLTGCQKQNTDGILMSDWIRMINEEAGIVAYRQKEPYYMNIEPGTALFDAVQAAVEWEILDPAVAFDSSAYLNRDWMAFTLMNLSGRKDHISGSYANDINRCQFPDAVNQAIASGLMKTDSRNLFHPERNAARDEAEAALHQVIRFLNSREMTDKESEVRTREDIEIKDEESDSFDPVHMTASFPDVTAGDYVRLNTNGTDEIYQVVDEADGHQKLTVPDVLSMMEEMHVSGSQKISFEDAEIIGPDGQTLYVCDGQDDASAKIRFAAMKPLMKQFQISGYSVTLYSSAGSISAVAERKLPHGGIFSVEAGISGMQVDYEWNYEDSSLKDAYFKADFHTTENLTVKGVEDKYLQGDFSKVDPASFLNTISGFYQEQKDVIQGTFTLCRIRIPLPQAPGLSVTADLDLNINAEGKAELSLGQDSVIGMEVRNGSLRLIRECDATREALVRSDFQFKTGVHVALNMLNMCLCDLLCEAGAAGSAKAVVHLYDEDGKMTNAATDVDAYAADLMSDGNERVFVCADLSGNWILDLSVNSAASACGKLGLKGEVHLLNEQNAPLIKGLSGHFENWKAVKQCTYADHEKGSSEERLRVSSNIVIEDYAMTIQEGMTKELKVLAVPAGYTLADLVYESENSEVASISGNVIQAHRSGSTTVSVSTRDGRYRIRCSILVPQVNS